MHDGRLLQKAVKLHPMGVTGLAEALKTSRVSVYRLFDKDTIDADTQKKISIILDTDVNTLFTDVTDEQGLSTGDKLRNQKAFGEKEKKGLIFVPIRAQAGYALEYSDPMFIEQLERILIPGLPYEGDRFRYFEVEGDSMEPTLKEGFYVIAEKVTQEDYQNTAQYYVYVIVKDSQILIKRLYRLDDGDYVMISDNEEYYPQVLLKKEEIKELWVVKRKMDWNMPPPRRIEITIKK